MGVVPHTWAADLGNVTTAAPDQWLAGPAATNESQEGAAADVRRARKPATVRVMTIP